MEALILVGHGSLRPGSGAAMIRLAARLGERGVAPLVAASFLNYSRPSFHEVLARLVRRGASSLLLQPYFLVPGVFVREALPRMLARALAPFPQLAVTLAGPLGAQPALADLVQKRAAAAGATPDSALLLVAHGTPDPAANAPVVAVAEMLRARGSYAAAATCYLGLNAPSIAEAVAAQIHAGRSQVVLVPYMLQLGGHVAEDLPAAAAEAGAAHPQARIVLAEHLGYDSLLADAIAASIAAARRLS